MPEIKQHVGYDWADIVQKGMQAAHMAYMDEVRKYKPSNPKSPTYGKDVAAWQGILNLPVAAQSASMEAIRKAVSAPRNSTSDVALEKVKADLAKVNESKAKVEKDFAELEKRYRELDGKYKSETRKKK